MCGTGLSRVADLTRRLQTQHGPFYRSADAYVLLLEEQQPDCVCNPRRPSQPRAHRCIAWRQIAMIEAYINPNHWYFYLPWKIEEDAITRAAQINPRLHAQAPQLLRHLPDHHPAFLLDKRASCDALRHHCSLCNRSCSSPTDLMQHVEQHHAVESQQSQALLHGLATHFLAHSAPLPCKACGVDHATYNLVDQSAWCALKHKCVVLQNLTFLHLLTRPDFVSHGRSKSGGTRRGQADSAAGDILRYARRRTDTGSTPVSGQEAESGTSKPEDYQALHDDSRSRRLQPDHTGLSTMPDASHCDPSSRGCPELPSMPGSVHPVPHSRSAGNVTSADPDSSGLEGAIQCHVSSPGGLDADPAGGTDETLQGLLYEALGRGLWQSIQTKVILEDNTVPYLQWNHQQKCLLPSQVQGMSIQDMEQRLQRLHSALQEPSNLIRFFALRSQGQTTGVTPWKIQLSMRNDALMCEMKHLLGSAIWMLIAGRLRAHSQQRSRAAQELQEIAYPRKPGNRRH